MRGALTRALLSIAAAGALLGTPLSAQKSPWGLRNLRKLPEGWNATTFPTEFTQHQAGHVAFWLFWGDVQPSGTETCTAQGEDQFALLDKMLGMVMSVGADPVIVFHASAGFGGGSFWAMKNEGGETPDPYTGPCDLITSGTTTWPPPPPKGYSPSLYDVSYAVATRIAQFKDQNGVPISGTVYLRFHNEAWAEWPLGPTSADWTENLDNYLRSYLTFRMAVLDAASDAGNTGLTFQVGHGSIPRNRLVPDYYYQLAVGGGDQIDIQWIIDHVNSYTERNRCSIGQAYGINMPINTWPKVVAYAGPGNANNQIYDAWMDKIVEWTAAGYFDFTTQHPHGKPFFLELEQSLFESRVAAVPGAQPAPPWLAAEAAFELLDEQGWGVIPCPGATLNTFVAQDLARKWCTLVANETTFCSPIIGGPHPKYIGLYQPSGTPGSATGCTSSSCPPLPPPENCVGGICPLPSNTAFVYLSGEIGQPDSKPSDLSADPWAHYRFAKSNPARIVDVVWRRTLFDGDESAGTYQYTGPSGYPNATVRDVFGTQIATSTGSVNLTNLGQAPRVVVWTP